MGTRASTVEATIAAGTIRGAVADGVASFKGIPYAAPPTGELRWRAPHPVEPWTGTRDCFAFGADCLQAPGSFEDIRTEPSEDCLYLNVWRPAEARPGDGRPVLVWIHGGAYVGGGSSVPVYDASAFARRGLVAVTFNYRLGRFGFFAHPAVVRASEDWAFGNYGYMDQIAALRWVRGNIAAFGGDPRRVTVVGESAGGESVIQLLTSPAVEEGLFTGAMVLSGGGRRSLFNRPLWHGTPSNMSATSIDQVVPRRHGVRGDGPDALAALRALEAAVLTGGQDIERLAKIRLLGGPLHGVPVVDGTIVTDEPEAHFQAGHCKRVPLVIGTVARDVPARFPPGRLRPLRWFGEDEEAAREAYGVAQGGLSKPDALFRLLTAIGADLTMHEPAHFAAATLRRMGVPAWVYRFTYTAASTRPRSTAQVHAGELPWLFDNLAVIYGDAVTAEDQGMADAFHGYAANFVARGDPNGSGLPAWPQAEPDRYRLMHFTLDDGPVYGPDPRASVPLVARARQRHDARAD